MVLLYFTLDMLDKLEDIFAKIIVIKSLYFFEDALVFNLKGKPNERY